MAAQPPGEAACPEGMGRALFLPYDINDGQHPGVLNLAEAWSPRSERRLAGARARETRLLATTEILTHDTTALSTPLLPTKDQLERLTSLCASGRRGWSAQHTPAVFDAVGEAAIDVGGAGRTGRRPRPRLGPTPAH